MRIQHLQYRILYRGTHDIVPKISSASLEVVLEYQLAQILRHCHLLEKTFRKGLQYVQYFTTLGTEIPINLTRM